MRVRGFLVAILVALVSAPAVARAGPAQNEARKAALEGTARFKAGQYQEALGFFLISYAKKKDPVVAWNIARCHEELGDLQAAVKYFEEFRATASDPAGRARADEKLAALRARIAAAEAAARPPEPPPPPPPPPRVAIDERARAVVKVLAMGLPRFARDGGRLVPVAVPDAGYGSGVVVSGDCVVLTNRHVVDGKVAVMVRFEGQERAWPAVVAEASREADVAVLVVERETCPDVMPVDAAAPVPERGRAVFRVGYGGEVPGSEAQTRVASVKRGVISRVAEVRGETLLEIDAPVNPGDSGGLLADEDGSFMGLTVARVEGAEGIGFAVPAGRAVAALRDAVERGAIAQARAVFLSREWPARRLLGDVCVDLVETRPDDMNSAILATEEKRARMARVFEESKGDSAAVLLLTAAAAWNVGTWMVLEGGPDARREGFRLLDKCLEAARAAPKKNPALASNDFVAHVDEAYRQLRRGKDPVVTSKPARESHPSDSDWEVRIGKSYDVYFHWLLWFHKVGDEHEKELMNFATGFQLPVVGNGRFEVGFGLGYGFSYFDLAGDINDVLHRIIFPFRARYWFLIADVGPQMVFHKKLTSSLEEKNKIEAGALVRAGFSVGAEVGFEYDHVPVLNEYVDFYGLYLGFGF